LIQVKYNFTNTNEEIKEEKKLRAVSFNKF